MPELVLMSNTGRQVNQTIYHTGHQQTLTETFHSKNPEIDRSAGGDSQVNFINNIQEYKTEELQKLGNRTQTLYFLVRGSLLPC